MFASPFWSATADVTRKHRAMLIGTIIGTGLLVFGLSQARSFWFIVLVIIGYAFLSAPILPIVDHTVVSLLGVNRDRYGRQRLWGAIGWGVIGPLTGWLVDQFGLLLIFPFYLVLFGLTLASILRLKIHPVKPAGAPFWRSLTRLTSNRRWLIFLFVAYVSGSCLGVVNNYLFLYMDELKSSSTLMGIALAVGTISEIPILFFSNWMLRRWGPRGLLTISLAAYVLRAFGYSIAAEPWQAVALQLLHGPTFSTMWVAGVSYASEIAPPGLGATAQSLFSSTSMGLGGITSAMAGGYLLDLYRGSGLFRVTAMAALVGLVIFILADRNSVRETS